MLTKRTDHILFIGHDDSVSGAPILLFNLLLLLQQENKCIITLVIRRGGTQLSVYQRYFPTIVLKDAGYGKEKSIIKRCINVLLNRIKLIKVLVKAASSRVIFSNTIVNGRLLKTLNVTGTPIITYVHELENVIESYLSKGDSSYSLRLSKSFAYPTTSVRKVLTEKYKINESHLLPLSYYFPVNQPMLENELEKAVFVNAFKSRYKLNDCELLVCGMGTAGKRKGIDLFIRVCEKVIRKNNKIAFCWIGKFEDEVIESEIKSEIREKGIVQHLVFTGVLNHHYYNLASFDLFFLSSREDPYPLVVLEAAFMKVPALCFEPSGGITDFIANDAGWIIPDYSIEYAADKILHLAERKELIREKGMNAFKKSILLHSNKKLVVDQFDELIRSV